jgi:hypothetical protein
VSKKSILQSEKQCFFCGTSLNLERHHCIHGTAGRRIADKLGLTIWLCSEHHRGKYSPHQNREIDLRLKRFAQSCYEDKHSREEWMQKVGRNYL